jgi:EAL domain-containing protein (putative c-di-GMP-specific phosphodiesterase class I)
MELGQSTLPLVNTIVTLAHNMGLSVTAEGVETAGQFKLVQTALCDKAQGHYFGNLLSADDVEELLRRGPITFPREQPFVTTPE